MRYDDKGARDMRAALARQAYESGIPHAVLHPGDTRGAMMFAAIENEGMATMLGFGHPVTAPVCRDMPLQILRARFSALASMHAAQGSWAAMAHPDGRIEPLGAVPLHPRTDIAA